MSQPDSLRTVTDASNRRGISRRRFVKILGASAAGLMLSEEVAARDQLQVDFHHGVASGDPLADRVVIWTRATSPQAAAFQVLWLVATDPQMTQVVTGGLAAADPAFDNTIKVDVAGLRPNTTYYYQFVYRGHRSAVGRTRTLAAGHLQQARFAVVSCSNHPKGYFHAYAELAQMDDLSFVLHLGDYIYEYGPDGYVTTANALLNVPQPRIGELAPPHECLTLDDYRARYALYRTDPDLQALHRNTPFICIWDDHETANNAWLLGAENHQTLEGEWLARREAGIRAFYEWLPIREPSSGERVQAWRSFALGDLARLMVLDTRLAARDLQFDAAALVGAYASATQDGQFPLDVTAAGAPRELLGEAQKTWFAGEMASASKDQTWQLVGQQILFFYQPAPDILGTTLISEEQKTQLLQGLDGLFGEGAGLQFAQIGAQGGPNPAMADSWTGYPSAKRDMALLLAAAPNPVVLSGDSHNAWAANLKLATPQGVVPIGVEFGGTSISSPGFEQDLIMLTPEQTAAIIEQASQANPFSDDLIYADASRRGFLVIDLTHERMRGEFYFLDSVIDRDYVLTLDQVLTVERNARRFSQDAAL